MHYHILYFMYNNIIAVYLSMLAIDSRCRYGAVQCLGASI